MNTTIKHAIILLLGIAAASCAPQDSNDILQPPSPDERRGTLVLAGGGSEQDRNGDSWSDRLYRHIIDASPDRRVLILSAEPENEWLPAYFRRLGAESAENLFIGNRRVADLAETAVRINKVGAVFIKGGDQSVYMANWENTRTMDALKALYHRGGVLAGTSAGAALLGGVVFTASLGTLYPEDALTDAGHPKMDLKPGFLDAFPSLLVDTHFTQRGRLPRLAVMLANWHSNHGEKDIIGLGLDDQTGVVLNADGRATVIGAGSVSFVRLGAAATLRMQSGRPPAVTPLILDQLTDGFVYALKEARVMTVPADARRVVPDLNRPGPESYPLRLRGDLLGDSSAGEVRLPADPDPASLYQGCLELETGRDLLPAAMVTTALYQDLDQIENRMGGTLLALYEHPGRFGLLLTARTRIDISAQGLIRAVEANGRASLLVVDSAGVERVAHSQYISIPEVSMLPRRSVALQGARIHILYGGITWNYQASPP